MSPPLILAFDTSVAHCAAALLSGDQVVASREEAMAIGQAERLVPLLEEILAEGRRGWGDLDALAVGTGPGNFTGVRIGVAAARGLALGLSIRAVGVTAFEALAWGHPSALVVRDARLGQVYLQRVGLPASAPWLQALDDPLPALDPGMPVIGDFTELVSARAGGTAAAALRPLAVAIGLVALGRLGQAGSRPAPLYLRAPDAAPPRDPAPVILPG